MNKERIEAERKRFEDWAIANGLKLFKCANGNGAMHYGYYNTRECWQAWLAALGWRKNEQHHKQGAVGSSDVFGGICGRPLRAGEQLKREGK